MSQPTRELTSATEVRADRRLSQLDRIERAVAGDAQAQSELAAALAPAVHARVALLVRRSYALSCMNRAAEIEDHVQDVFELLFRNQCAVLAEWQPDRGLSLESFAALVAERQVLSSLRRCARRARLSGQESVSAPVDLDAEERRLASRRLLETVSRTLAERVSPAALELFVRLYICEESTDSIQVECGLSAAAVYQWKTRLGRLAREAVAELDGSAATRSKKPCSTRAICNGALE